MVEIDAPMSLGMFLLIILVGSILFEVILLSVAFFGADKVECNLLWCTFTTTRSEGVTHQISYRDCYENGIRINCSLENESFNSLKCFDYDNSTFCKGVN